MTTHGRSGKSYDFDYVAVIPRTGGSMARAAEQAGSSGRTPIAEGPVAKPLSQNQRSPVLTAPASAPSSMRSDVALIGVYEISKVLTRTDRLEGLLSAVVNLLSSFMQMGHGAITLIDAAGDADLRVGAAWVEGADQGLAARLPQPVIDQIVATGVPLVVHDVARNPLFAGSALLEGPQPVSFIGVPLRIDAAIVGTLTIDRAFDPAGLVRFDADVRFLTMVANLVSQTVRLHRSLAHDRERLMVDQARLEKELSSLKGTGRRQGRIIGSSPAIRAVVAMAERVARSSTTVLLRGESGTGKELFAQMLHEAGTRAKGPFVKLNCAALPETVLESELFGHEKGAFTGALSARTGRFEAADGGTLFLDEIGEISGAFQAKLLRVLQEGEFERVGGNRTIKVDVRIVAATNRDLEGDVLKGSFRADLYYRLSVVPITLPPLRERRADIPVLAQEFLRRFNAENDQRLMLSRDATALLANCAFPGNVRELENCVRRTATLSRAEVIQPDDFACRTGRCLSSMLGRERIGAEGHAAPGLAPEPVRLSAVPHRQPTPAVPLPVISPSSLRPDALGSQSSACACAATDPTITACPPPGGCVHAAPKSERERLIEAMERTGWVQAKAARMLNLTPRQIGYALKKHGIELQRL